MDTESKIDKPKKDEITVEASYPWKSEQENILKKWADKGQCFKAMHERAYKRFWCLNAWFTIPTIILSTITGTGNFAQNLFGDWAQYAVLIIGGMNLFSAIIVKTVE